MELCKTTQAHTGLQTHTHTQAQFSVPSDLFFAFQQTDSVRRLEGHREHDLSDATEKKSACVHACVRARCEERGPRGGGPVAGGTDFKREENALEKMELRRRTEKEQERTRGRGGRGEKKRFQRIPGLDGELGVCLCVCHMFLNRTHMAPRGFIHPSVSLSHVSNPLMSLPIKQTHCQPGSE